MKTLADLLEVCNTHMPVLKPNVTVADAIRLMVSRDQGAVLISDGLTVSGIFSERDLTKRVLAFGQDPNKIQINTVMTKKVIFANPETTIEDCMQLMHRYRVRQLPVISGANLVGSVSVLDVVAAVLKERETIITSLEEYVATTWPI